MKVCLCGGEGREAMREELNAFKDWMAGELRLIFGFVSEPVYAVPSKGLLDDPLGTALSENAEKEMAELERWRIGNAAQQGVGGSVSLRAKL